MKQNKKHIKVEGSSSEETLEQRASKNLEKLSPATRKWLEESDMTGKDGITAFQLGGGPLKKK